MRVRVADGWTRPDVVFTRARVAVFVDGCFWHSCPEHGSMPIANRKFWEAKLARNVERDRENVRALEAAGWTVLRFYEHVPAGDAAAVIRRAVSESLTDPALIDAPRLH